MSPTAAVTGAAGASIVLALGLVVQLFLRSSSPPERHAAAVATLTLSLLVPGLVLLLPGASPLGPSGPRLAGATAMIIDGGVAVSGGRALGWIVRAWLVVAGLLLLRTAGGIMSFLSRFGRATPIDGTRVESALRAVTEGDREPSVDVRVADDDVPPCTWGIARCRILLPVSSVHWPYRNLQMVLRHELAHGRRRDGTFRLLASVAVALNWWNPVAWLLAARVRWEGELAADDRVVAAGTSPTAYARVLLDSASPRTAPTPVSAASADLERRVRRLLSSRISEASPLRSVLVVALLVLGSLAVSSGLARVSQGLEFALRYRIPGNVVELVRWAAATEHVDQEMAFSLVQEESRFRTDAISPAGAVGLTQILPGTALRLEPGVTPDQLRDPATNLRLGFRLLRRNLNHFHGDVEAALLAYQAGPNAVRRSRAGGRSLAAAFRRSVSRILSRVES